MFDNVAAERVREIQLPQVHDPRGDLTFVEGGHHIPFPINRVYYLYNVPVDAERGGHAHKALEQVVFALSGSFRMTVDDGSRRTEYWLRDPRKGLYISVWCGEKWMRLVRARSVWCSPHIDTMRVTITAILTRFFAPWGRGVRDPFSRTRRQL